MTATTPTKMRALLVLLVLAASAPAFAQDGGPHDPKEIEKKVVEIEHLMKKAEDSLAKSLDAKEPGADASEKIEKLLDDKARKETGKSAEELRKLADGGSSEASKTLAKLLEESKGEAGAAGASEGIKKLLEETKSGGKGAAKGIEWLLMQAQKGGTRSSGDSDPNQPKPDQGEQGPDKKPDEKKPEGKDKKPENGKDPKDPDKSKSPEPPESKREKPRSPEFDQWYATLPPQVRKQFDMQDWDAIPPQFRSILQAWTKKMADEKDKPK